MQSNDPFYDPYRAPQTQWGQSLPPVRNRRLEAPHSGLGIASFIISLLGGLTAFVTVVLAGLMASGPRGMDENSPEAFAVGCTIFGVIGLILVGLALGVAGLFQQERKKVFAVLGVVFNALVVVFICGIMAVGLAVGG